MGKVKNGTFFTLHYSDGRVNKYVRTSGPGRDIVKLKDGVM